MTQRKTKTIGPADVPLDLGDVQRLHASGAAVWLEGVPYRVVRIVSAGGTWRAGLAELQR